METFNFPYHLENTEYPESSTRMQFGKNWTFAAAPNAPDDRVFMLTFEALKYFLDSEGQIDTTTEPLKNMGALEEFYQNHGTWKNFLYDHPRFGVVTVKFKRPLVTPKPLPYGTGATEAFEIVLIEQP